MELTISRKLALSVLPSYPNWEIKYLGRTPQFDLWLYQERGVLDDVLIAVVDLKAKKATQKLYMEVFDLLDEIK